MIQTEGVKTMMRRLLPRRDDDGVALIAAMAVVMLVGILVVVTIKIAIAESTATGRDRQRSSAVSTAESQVDTIMSQIQSSAPAALSAFCGTLAGSADIARDDFGLSSTVTYYKADGVTEVPCASIPTTQVGYAKVRTSATSVALAGTASAKRSVESLLRLTPAYGNDLDKAIFSNSTLTMSNKTVLTSASGTPDADIYTNGDFYCRNNQEFHGSIFAQGSVFLESQCTVSVDVWAKGQVRITNPSASIGGRVLSATSTVSLDKASLGQQARAAGAVTGQICSVAGKCFSNVQVDAPPTVAFPALVWDAATQAQWAAHGYSAVTLPQGNFTCGWYNPPNGTPKLVGADGKATDLNGKATGIAAWLFANAYKLSGPTIVISDCPSDKVILQGIGITMNNNIVLVSRGGRAVHRELADHVGDRDRHRRGPQPAVPHPARLVLRRHDDLLRRGDLARQPGLGGQHGQHAALLALRDPQGEPVDHRGPGLLGVDPLGRQPARHGVRAAAHLGRHRVAGLHRLVLDRDPLQARVRMTAAGTGATAQ